MIVKFKIKGLPKDSDYIKLSFGRQIEYRRKIQEFQDAAKSTHLSQKRQTYSKAIKEFLALNDVTEYYTTFHASKDCFDDSFEVWYR